MDFATIEPALRALVATATGIEASCCVFENAPRPIHNGKLALLSWVSTEAPGGDDLRWDYVADADPLAEMRPTVAGPRAATLQVSVETQNQTPGLTARALAETARARLQWPSARASLAAVGLALVSVAGVRQADYRVDGRWMPRALFEVRLNGASSAEDVAGRTSYIATVGVTATVTRPDDAPVLSSLQPSGES